MPSSAIEPGSTVLVAGGTGYIGATTSLFLLKAGFKVRATTRSVAKVQYLHDRFEKDFPGQFELIEVKEWTAPGAYDEALRGAEAFIVVAGDTSFGSNTEDILANTAQAVTKVLDSASRSAVKRVVLTSSRVAAYKPLEDSDYEVNEKTWNDGIVELARSLPADHPAKGGATYAAGKVVGEKAAWNFVAKHKPHFVFNTVLPEQVVGENLSKNPSTGPWLNDFFRGDKRSPAVGMMQIAGYYVSNNDTARLHLAAIKEPDVVDERLFGAAHPFTINQCLAIARKHRPEHNFPEDLSGTFAKPTKVTVRNERSLELLRRQGQQGWEDLEESIVSNLVNL